MWTPAYERSQFDPRTKTKSICISHTKPSSFRSQHQSQVNFDPHSRKLQKQVNLDASVTKNKLPSILTLNQVIFDLHSKPSQFRSLHWNDFNADGPHWYQVQFDHPPNKLVNFDAITRTMSLPAGVIVCYTYGYMFLWYSSNRYHTNSRTNS